MVLWFISIFMSCLIFFNFGGVSVNRRFFCFKLSFVNWEVNIEVVVFVVILFREYRKVVILYCFFDFLFIY